MIRVFFDSGIMRTMHELSIYKIEVGGCIDGKDLEALCPVRVDRLQAGPHSTAFTICTDQSGLIGLIRHLHNRGVLILTVKRHRRGQNPNKYNNQNR